jgi:hypothetical protein
MGFIIGTFLGSLILFPIIKLLLNFIRFKKPIHLFVCFCILLFFLFFGSIDLYDLYINGRMNSLELYNTLATWGGWVLSFFITVLSYQSESQDEISLKLYLITRRSLAALIDNIFLLISASMLSNFFDFKFTFFLLSIVYFSVFEVYSQTIGKLCMKLFVDISNVKGFLLNLIRNVIKCSIVYFTFFVFLKSNPFISFLVCLINIFSLLLFKKNYGAWYDLGLKVSLKQKK